MHGPAAPHAGDQIRQACQPDSSVCHAQTVGGERRLSIPRGNLTTAGMRVLIRSGMVRANGELEGVGFQDARAHQQPFQRAASLRRSWRFSHDKVCKGDEHHEAA